MLLNDVLPTKPAGSAKPGSQALNSASTFVQSASDQQRISTGLRAIGVATRLKSGSILLLPLGAAGARQGPVPDEGVLQLARSHWSSSDRRSTGHRSRGAAGRRPRCRRSRGGAARRGRSRRTRSARAAAGRRQAGFGRSADVEPISVVRTCASRFTATANAAAALSSIEQGRAEASQPPACRCAAGAFQQAVRAQPLDVGRLRDVRRRLLRAIRRSRARRARRQPPRSLRSIPTGTDRQICTETPALSDGQCA